ncbi:phytoene dehydrogenase [Halobacteriales archaeon QS_8_69_26]|nr:MAG: phytoene dehydrogenase [Halobacteriales archaeon QS_8_69_26]
MDGTVVVVGGGLAGLVAARHLAEAGADVTVFERRDEVGGRVRSVRREGYVFDRGFQVLFDNYPAAMRELRYDELDLKAFRPGAVIARGDRRSVLADPLGDPGAAVESLFNRRVSTADKLRTLRLRWDLRGRSEADLFSGPDTSIAEYLRERGFSERFVENFAAPFYGGITLDRSLSGSKRVFEYTFQRLASGRTVVPAFGMGAIPDSLRSRAEAVGATVETGVRVTDVDPTGTDASGEVEVHLPGETVEADAAVVATDPSTARELTDVDGIPTDGKGCVTQYYAPSGDLGVDRRIVLNAEDAWPNQVVPHTEVAPSYAPPGGSLISATFLGTPGEDDEELAEMTRNKLSRWFPERNFRELELLHTARVPFAQFEQPPGVHETLPDADDPAGPVYLAGDYTRWSSIQGALESGTVAADAAEAALQ